MTSEASEAMCALGWKNSERKSKHQSHYNECLPLITYIEISSSVEESQLRDHWSWTHDLNEWFYGAGGKIIRKHQKATGHYWCLGILWPPFRNTYPSRYDPDICALGVSQNRVSIWHQYVVNKVPYFACMTWLSLAQVKPFVKLQ